MRNAYGKAFANIMARNEKIVALIADVGPVGYADLKKNYPNRVFNFGIAESNMVASAAAMAKEGLIPVVFGADCYLAYRTYEFIRIDVCLQKRNVKFVGEMCGVICNNFGPTHHAIEDIAVLRVLPNITLLSPASVKEVAPVLENAITHQGPVFIRIGKAFETEIYENTPQFEIGKANIIQNGKDITIIATGSIIADAIEAAERLRGGGGV